MNNIKFYAFPSTVREAVGLLLDRKYKAMALAGGTLAAKALPAGVETYLDVRNIPMKQIKLQAGSLVIGAGATFDEVDRSELCRAWAGGVIAEAAGGCSSQLIRNMATVGGNIARPHAFNIFPVLLLGLDAKVRLAVRSGARVVEFGRLYSPALGLRPGFDSLITEVIIPAKTRRWNCEFIKLARTGSSWESMITLFFAAEKKGGIVQARVSVGGLGPRPWRAAAAEAAAEAGVGPGAAAGAFRAELAAARAGTYRCEASAGLFKRFLGRALL